MESPYAAWANGRYIIHDKLGQGGMGIVYQATDRLTGQTVALKQVLLLPQQDIFGSQSSPHAQSNLRLALAHEFKVLASLRHPNIISVLDYGFDRQRQPYFTMSYLEDAKPLLAAGEDQPLEQRVDLIRQMLEALVYLHRRGVLHRDLKPENVLVADQTVHVLDFGLASAKEDATESVGSWLYVAPELLNGDAATELADLYSVGVLAYRLFAGKHPFDFHSGDFIDQVLFEPPDLSAMPVPEPLRRVVGRLLAKKPQQRYVSAQATITALSRAIGLAVPEESVAVRESFLQAAQFVGREAEMQQLLAAIQAAQNRQGSAWLVGGESGVGKSRLLDEVRTQALVQGALVVTGQGVENRSGSPYQLWREVVRRLALITELDDLAVGVLQAIVPDIGKLLDRDVLTVPELQGQAGRQRLFSTILQLFRQQEQWVCLFLEDLHWADESLSILQQLTRLTGELPLLIIGSYRNEERPNLPELLPDIRLLTLARLSADEMVTLSSAMLGQAGAQPEVLALLQRETEGNAFFLVEVVRDLAEQAGRLSAVGQMELPERLFPQGIESVIRRRLMRVPEAAQGLLPGAAVAGRQIDLPVVRQLAQQVGLTMPLADWLAVCAETAVLDIYDGNWRFAHDKLREGILGTLAPPDRARWHGWVARAIEQVYPEDAEQAGVLVTHWREASNEAKERHYALMAGHYARKQFSNREAIDYLNRALALTAVDDLPGRYEILLAQEQVHSLLGERAAQQQELAQLKTVADELAEQGVADWRAAVALRQGRYAEVTGDYAAAVQAAQEAIRLAWATSASQDEAAGYLSWGRALLRQGNSEAATAKFSQALAQAQASKLLQIEADSLRFLGVVAMESGGGASGSRLSNAALGYYQRALPIYQQIADRQGESTVLNNLGNLYQAMGDSAAAQMFWAQAQRTYGQIGDREGNGRILTNLSAVSIDLGDYAEARRYSEEALYICREIGVRLGECFALLNLAVIYHYQNNHVSAEMYSRQALSIAEAMGVAPLRGNTLLVLGHALAGQKNAKEALKVYHQALAIWQEMNHQALVMEAEASLARIALEQHDWAAAEEHVAQILAFLAEGHSLDGAEQPFRIYLTCYRYLSAEDDPRAEAILQTAYELLQARAMQITDPLRQRLFLQNITVHQEIMEAYRQMMG